MKPSCLMPAIVRIALVALVLAQVACQRDQTSNDSRRDPSRGAGDRPSILLITLDTTRADALEVASGPGTVTGPSAHGVSKGSATSDGATNGTNSTEVSSPAPATLAPTYQSLVRAGVSFTAAHATAPMTLPSHVSMFTGLYPGDHGIHENARTIDPSLPLAAELLSRSGYETAAFVSGLPLASQFGLARGFDVYDDDLAGTPERSATATTDAALGYLSQSGHRSASGAATDEATSEATGSATKSTTRSTTRQSPAGAEKPHFLWVHYFDAHAPYDPPAQFQNPPGIADHPLVDSVREGPAGTPGNIVTPRNTGHRTLVDVGQRRSYLGEIATVDHQMARLIEAFQSAHPDQPIRILVVGDHGESLGEHGERFHGNLLFEAALRVPMVAVGEPGVTPGSIDTAPVSVRRVFGTLLHWAQVDGGSSRTPAESLFDPPEAVVMAEAMQPYLQYGWQPMVAAVAGHEKMILSGSAQTSDGSSGRIRLLSFDLDSDPHELNPRSDLEEAAESALRAALRAYPLPESMKLEPEELPEQTRAQLASLGYISGARAPERRNGPSALEMVSIFDDLDLASGAFEHGDFQGALAPLQRVLAADPGNFAAVLRLAVARAALGRPEAEAAFARARALAPDSPDLRHFEGMYRLRQGRLDQAIALFDSVLKSEPDRQSTLDGLVQAHRRRGDLDSAVTSLARLVRLAPSQERWLELGQLQMSLGRTTEAIAALEAARTEDLASFEADLDLGVLYLAARRFTDARDALDRALHRASERASRPAKTRDRDLPMILFKRAQVSVLLNEPDARSRIEQAREGADELTEPLIAQESLFQRFLSPR